jgi:hypothetical protein
MSMGMPENSLNLGESLDGAEDVEEISVDITEEGYVWLHGSGWELYLSPVEARTLGEALQDAATDAEQPVPG